MENGDGGGGGGVGGMDEDGEREGGRGRGREREREMSERVLSGTRSAAAELAAGSSTRTFMRAQTLRLNCGIDVMYTGQALVE